MGRVAVVCCCDSKRSFSERLLLRRAIELPEGRAVAAREVLCAAEALADELEA